MDNKTSALPTGVQNTGHAGSVVCIAQSGVVETFGRLKAPSTEEEMRGRISMLSFEMDANDEENRQYKAEIDALYAKIDSMPK